MARGLVPCMEEGEEERLRSMGHHPGQADARAGRHALRRPWNIRRSLWPVCPRRAAYAGGDGEIGMFLAAVRRVRSYLDKGMSYGIPLSRYGKPQAYDGAEGGNRGAIRHGRVDDRASNTLRDIRRDLQLLEEKSRIRRKPFKITEKVYGGILSGHQERTAVPAG